MAKTAVDGRKDQGRAASTGKPTDDTERRPANGTTRKSANGAARTPAYGTARKSGNGTARLEGKPTAPPRPSATDARASTIPG